MEALQEPKCRQITTTRGNSPLLKSKPEILFNVMGRFLQLREFVNEKHELTGWGRALRKALSSLDAPDKLEDSVYLAIEALRLGLLDERHVALGSTKAKAGK